MTTERRLRAAIFARPDDDAPRLVYADWLLERGDPRGEFIQIQCTLGRPISSRGPLAPNHPAARPMRFTGDPKPLEARERALLRAHQKTWIAPIRGYINSWYWDRGFVSRIDVNIEKLIAHAAEIFDFTPLHAAYLMGCTPPRVAQLAKTERASSLRWLALDAQRIGAREAEVFRSPRFAALETLSLQHNPFGDDAVAVLASSTSLGALRSLDLGYSEVELTSAGIESLSRAAFFPQLATLALDCSLARGTAIRPILERGTRLTSLSLGPHRITKQEATLRAARGLAEP
jgi:uncharacterized protein (TIGR02996 family)